MGEGSVAFFRSIDKGKFEIGDSLAGHPVLPFFAFYLVDGQLSIGVQCLVQADVSLKLRILSDKLQQLVYDFVHLVFDLVKNPVIVSSESKHSGIFQVDQMTGRFSLSEFQDPFQVGYAHFPVFENEVQYPETGLVRASFENLRT